MRSDVYSQYLLENRRNPFYAGILFLYLTAYHLEKIFLYIHPNGWLHGREQRVEGILLSTNHFLLVDDFITRGASFRKAVAAIRTEGGVVTGAIVLLDREEGGKENLAKDYVKLNYLLTPSEVDHELYEMDIIKIDQLRIILKQLKRK